MLTAAKKATAACRPPAGTGDRQQPALRLRHACRPVGDLPVEEPVPVLSGGMAAPCFLVPGFIGALIALWRKTADTKGLNLDTVTGCEWD